MNGREVRKGKRTGSVMGSTMKTSATSRRRFLQTTFAGAVSLPAWAAPLGANSDVRVAVIGFRGRGGGHIKELLKEKAISEDEERRAEQNIQKLTDTWVAAIDKKFAEKETDLLAI